MELMSCFHSHYHPRSGTHHSCTSPQKCYTHRESPSTYTTNYLGRSKELLDFHHSYVDCHTYIFLQRMFHLGSGKPLYQMNTCKVPSGYHKRERCSILLNMILMNRIDMNVWYHCNSLHMLLYKLCPILWVGKYVDNCITRILSHIIKLSQSYTHSNSNFIPLEIHRSALHKTCRSFMQVILKKCIGFPSPSSSYRQHCLPSSNTKGKSNGHCWDGAPINYEIL